MKMTSPLRPLVALAAVLALSGSAQAALITGVLEWTGKKYYRTVIHFQVDPSVVLIDSNNYEGGGPADLTSPGLNSLSAFAYDPEGAPIWSMLGASGGNVYYMLAYAGYFRYNSSTHFASFSMYDDTDGSPTHGIYGSTNRGSELWHEYPFYLVDSSRTYSLTIDGVLVRDSVTVPDHASTATLMLGALAGLGLFRKRRHGVGMVPFRKSRAGAGRPPYGKL